MKVLTVGFLADAKNDYTWFFIALKVEEDQGK